MGSGTIRETHTSLEVVDAPLASLHPHPRNPRTITPARLAQLCRTLDAERDMLRARPIVALPDGTVIAGNQRLAAAIELGWETIPTVFADVDDERAVRWMLLDNRGFGADDAGMVAELLAEIEGAGSDLLLTGYEAGETDRLLRAYRLRDKDPDDAPPLPAGEPRSRRGEVYELGPHRLMCGDATSAEDVETLTMDGVDAALTDPPYGIDYEYLAHDDDPETNASLVEQAFALCPETLIWTCGKRNLARDISRFGECAVAIWDKGFAQAGSGLGGASTWEPILVRSARVRRLSNDVLRVGTDRVAGLRELHPCPKPVDLYAQLCAAFTLRADQIYDPFAGSGTTMIAAEITGRRCLAMEIDPAYCDVIRDRYEAFVA